MLTTNMSAHTRNRVTVPVELTRGMNLQPGDRVYVTRNRSNGLSVRTSPPSRGSYGSYTVDRDSNIRIGGRWTSLVGSRRRRFNLSQRNREMVVVN